LTGAKITFFFALQGNKESADPRWRSGTQGRGGKGGRGNYSARQSSNSSGMLALLSVLTVKRDWMEYIMVELYMKLVLNPSQLKGIGGSIFL
jgi:hypothetical protein